MKINCREKWYDYTIERIFFTRKKCFCFKKLIFKDKDFDNSNNNVGTTGVFLCDKNTYAILLCPTVLSADSTIDGNICKTLSWAQIIK